MWRLICIPRGYHSFYRCVSVHRVGGGWAGTPQTRYTPWAGTPPGTRYTSQTRYTPWDHIHPSGPGTHPWTRYNPLGPGTPPRTGTPPGTWYTPLGPGTPPEQCMLGDTGNKRAVRIPTEMHSCVKIISYYYFLK